MVNNDAIIKQLKEIGKNNSFKMFGKQFSAKVNQEGEMEKDETGDF